MVARFFLCTKDFLVVYQLVQSYISTSLVSIVEEWKSLRHIQFFLLRKY